MKTLLVIDGQGGGCGRALIERLVQRGLPLHIVAAGTNALATAAMLKAGAKAGASGENAIVVNSAEADVIAGPIGIVLANALMGECTPAIAAAVGGARAPKVLIPSGRCGTYVAGVPERPMAAAIEDAVDLIARCLEDQ